MLPSWLIGWSSCFPSVLNEWPACQSGWCLWPQLWLRPGSGLGRAAGLFSSFKSSVPFPSRLCPIFCSLTSAGVRWMERGSLPTSSCRDGEAQKGKLHKKREILLSYLSISILLSRLYNVVLCMKSQAWFPISYQRRTVQPLYYSAMRGKRGGLQALHYSGGRGKRAGEGTGFPQMVFLADGSPYNQWREWN